MADRLQYLVLADSVLLLEGPTGLSVVTDDREAQVGQKYRDRMDALASGSSAHREAHRECVETLRSFRNGAGGFWVASVDSAVADEAIIGEQPLSELDAAVLLSDGASRLVDRFGQESWSDLVHLARHEGPDAVIDEVRQLETSDPEGTRWPRGKAYDDATVAVITVLGGAC